MGFMDKVKAKTGELATKAKPMVENAKAKSGPMAKTMQERGKDLAGKAKESAAGFRESHKGQGSDDAVFDGTEATPGTVEDFAAPPAPPIAVPPADPENTY